jgi:FkbM family methyltransferase
LKEVIKRAVVSSLWIILGRKNLARFARMLNNEVRLDVRNDMDSNGERLVQETVAQNILPETPVIIFDVGANIGDWTRGLLNQCIASGLTNVRIHAFEPCQATYDIALRNLAQYTNAGWVTVVMQALSNVSGTAVLNVVGDGVGTNSLHSQPDLSILRQESVSLTTIDEYCARYGINHITLLKTDTEGHDQAVMEGAIGMLSRHAIELIQFEYNHRWISSRHYLYDAFDLLGKRGYKLGKITPLGIELYREWHPELETFREGNYLASIPAWVPRFPHIHWWNEI